MSIGRPAKRFAICAVAVASVWLATPDTAHAADEPLLRQSKTGESTSPTDLVLNIAPVQNNLLVAIYTSRLTGTMTGPAGWSTAVVSDGASPSIGIWYKVAGAGESQTVSASTTASGTANGLAVMEFMGTATSSVFDAGAFTSGSSSTVSSGTASPSNGNGVIIAGLVSRGGNNFSSQTNSFIELHDFLSGGGARTEMLMRLSDAPWLVTYVGHGATTTWGQATDLLSTADIEALSGPPASLLVALTCLTGFFTSIYPPEAGIAEAFLRAPGGAVAVWGSSSLTTAPGQIAAARRFLTGLAAGDAATLGQAVRAARGATTDPDVRASWILFGDPALRIRFN